MAEIKDTLLSAPAAAKQDDAAAKAPRRRPRNTPAKAKASAPEKRTAEKSAGQPPAREKAARSTGTAGRQAASKARGPEGAQTMKNEPHRGRAAGGTDKNAAKSAARNPGAPKNTSKSPAGNKGSAAKGAQSRSADGQQKNQPAKRRGRPPKSGKGGRPLRIVSLGGLDEIGKNVTLYEYGDDMMLVDCGMTFPDEDMPGIDIVIPDFTYILKNKDRIKGLVVTHGHEDHIGAIPYLLKEFNVPIYGTRLTIGLISGKLKEHRLLNSAKLHVIQPGDTVQLGAFSVEAIHVNHSIPDAVAYAIRCPAGLVVQTGDYKIDTTPIDSQVIDLGRFAELGKEGV